MKLPSIIVLTLSTYHVYAFSVVRTIIPTTKSMNSSMKSTTTTSLRETSLFFAEETKTEEKEDINEEENMESMVGSSTSFESMSGSIYDRLGFQEEQIAIGIKPEDVSNTSRCHIYDMDKEYIELILLFFLFYQ